MTATSESSATVNDVPFDVLAKFLTVAGAKAHDRDEILRRFNRSLGNAYSGMPDRLYVIDPDGKVAYKGARGPFGFKPDEMEQALLMLQLDRELQKTKTTR